MKLLIVLLTATTFVSCDLLNVDESDWVDPSNMFTFDPGTKTTIEDKQEVLPEAPKCPECPKCEQNTSECKGVNEVIFMRRYISYLLFKLSGAGHPPNKYQVSLRLSEDDWNLFRKFADQSSEVAIQDVVQKLEGAMNRVAVETESADQSDWKIAFVDYFNMEVEEALKISLFILLLTLILTSELVSNISWGRQAARLFWLAVVVSFPWTYIHEYKMEYAAHLASASNIPEHCSDITKEMSFSGSLGLYLRDMFSTAKDPCARYHENHLIDPIFKVPPTKVLAVTASRFFFEPLQQFGSAFSVTFKNVFADLPLQLWIPAFIFLLVSTLAVLAAIWSTMNSTSGGQNLRVRQEDEILRLQSENHRLSSAVESLSANQNAAIEAPPPPTSSGLLGWVFGRNGNQTNQETLNNQDEPADDHPPQPVITPPQPSVATPPYPPEVTTLPQQLVTPYPPQVVTPYPPSPTTPYPAPAMQTPPQTPPSDGTTGGGDAPAHTERTFCDSLCDPPPPYSPLPDGVQGRGNVAHPSDEFPSMLSLGRGSTGAVMATDDDSLLLRVAEGQIEGRRVNTVGGSPMEPGDPPNIMGDHPNIMGDHPGTVGDHPDFMGDHPNIMGDHPDTVGDDPDETRPKY